MKYELNEKIYDFHKNIDKIQAAEMTVNEGLEYTTFKPYCCKTFNVSNKKAQANILITNYGLTTNVKVYIPLTEIVYLSLVKIDVCPTGYN